MPGATLFSLWLKGVRVSGFGFWSVADCLCCLPSPSSRWCISASAGGDEESFSGFGPKIGVVELEGVIVSPKQVVKQLKEFADDDSIKAIMIHVNSPGGGVAASEEIYREVKRIRDEKKKRIVASIETVGASGAYYVASATNKIYADKGSIVGSIGVIAEWVNYGELLKWAKLQAITMKAGEFKDTGSPTREMTPAEREVFSGDDRRHAHVSSSRRWRMGGMKRWTTSARLRMARCGRASRRCR